MRHPIPLLEIDRVQRGAESGPMTGGPTELVQARGLQRVVRQADNRAAVEILHGRLILKAAPFQQQHLL